MVPLVGRRCTAGATVDKISHEKYWLLSAAHQFFRTTQARRRALSVSCGGVVIHIGEWYAEVDSGHSELFENVDSPLLLD